MRQRLQKFSRMSFSHVPKDELHVFGGDHGANSHVALDRGHHARRKLVRRHMAPAAIGMKPLLSFDTPVGRALQGLRMAWIRGRT